MKQSTEPGTCKAATQRQIGKRRGRLFLRAQMRTKRLWSLWLQRLMNLRFPTLGAGLTVRQKKEVRALLKPGDILLKDNCSYPLSQLGARVLGSSWIHSAVCVGEGKLIDCGSKPYVAQILLDDFLDASDLAVYRPRFETDADRESALNFLYGQIGRPFNKTFKLSNKNSFYCTQLVYRMLEQMPHPIEFHVSRLGKRPVILASDIETCPQLECVYLFRVAPWRACITHMPSLLALCVGSAVSSRLSPQFSVLGALLTLASFLTIGQCLQNSKRKRRKYSHAN